LRDNLDAPLPGDRGAHGPFGDRAQSFDARLWIRLHPKLASAIVGLAAALAIVSARRAANREHGAMRSG
jgi:hypothetical protein